MLKITEAPALIHAGLYHLELDGRQVGTVNVFSGCLDAIRAALEETPEAAYLLEEQARKLENAEMLIERLKREVMALSFSVELHDRAAEKARALWAEAHPDEAEEWLRREDLMVWMIERVEKAEAVKESLTSALRDIKKNVDDWNLQDYVTIRRLVNAALRTTEEPSVVDGPPAKQPEDSANSDGDWDSVIDEEVKS